MLVAAAQYGQPAGGQPQDHAAQWAAYYAQQGGQPQVTAALSETLAPFAQIPSEFAEVVGLVADEMMPPVLRLC